MFLNSGVQRTLNGGVKPLGGGKSGRQLQISEVGFDTPYRTPLISTIILQTKHENI